MYKVFKCSYRDIYYAKYCGKGGGDGQLRKKIGVRVKKIKRGKERRRQITLKKGEKALKIHLFGPQTYLSGKKLISKEGGGGGKLSKCTIYIPVYICK